MRVNNSECYKIDERRFVVLSDELVGSSLVYLCVCIAVCVRVRVRADYVFCRQLEDRIIIHYLARLT